MQHRWLALRRILQAAGEKSTVLSAGARRTVRP